MTIVVDANVAIAVLDPADLFHRAAIRRCVEEGDIAILNLTHAEALIHPTRLGRFDDAAEELSRLGFIILPIDNEVANRARLLRAEYGNRNFPMVDAIVVGLGVENNWTVVTCDAKWPPMQGIKIEVLTPTR
ncbi:MAG: PIN domain-containing protein [Ilumatobacteraceae bacterium]